MNDADKKSAGNNVAISGSAGGHSACGYGDKQLASLLYDDGDPAELAQTRAHLAECAGCRAELEELVSMKSLLSAWPNAVNAPRMVYINEPSGFLARVRRWAEGIGDFGHGFGLNAVLKPAMAAAAAVMVSVLVLAVSVAVLDVRVAPDGSLQVGFAGFGGRDGSGAQPTAEDLATAAADAPITREEFEQGLAQAVAYLDDLYQSRSAEERRLLMAAIDERMEDQGLMMSDELRGVMNAALTDMQQQHEGDLRLIFSAVDELGVMTGAELQRMNMILTSLMPSGPMPQE
jgi:hypothetical protein